MDLARAKVVNGLQGGALRRRLGNYPFADAAMRDSM